MDSSLVQQSTRHKIRCHRCDEPIEDWCETRRYGFWDVEAQNYESRGGVEHRYCRECWNGREGRTNGAHYFPETADELFNVLEAADGSLAAVLTWWTGRPAVRVVGGEPEAAVTKPERGGHTSDGTPILNFEPKRVEDFGRERFYEDADPPEDRGLVLLLNPDRTPFGGLDDE